MPTSPQTSILAAVTQAFPGPTIRSTGSIPLSGRPYARAPMAWAPPATHERVHAEQAGRTEEHRVDAAVAIGGCRDDDPTHAGDACRHDGHQQGTGVRRRAAGHVGTDAGQGRPATLDVDPVGDPGVRRRRDLGPRERGDVGDRGLERGADRRSQGVRGRREVGRIRRSGRPSPIRRRTARWRPGRRHRHARRTSSSVARTASRTAGSGTAPRRTSARRSATAAGSPAATSARSSRRRDSVAGTSVVVTGRSSRWGARGCRTHRRSSGEARVPRPRRPRRPCGRPPSRRGRAG